MQQNTSKLNPAIHWKDQTPWTRGYLSQRCKDFFFFLVSHVAYASSQARSWNRWKDIPGSCIERIKAIKMAILPKAIYWLNTIPIKWPRLLVYTIATEMPDLSHVFNLHHSSQQCQILNPLIKARNLIHILMDAGWVHYYWAMTWIQ